MKISIAHDVLVAHLQVRRARRVHPISAIQALSGVQISATRRRRRAARHRPGDRAARRRSPREVAAPGRGRPPGAAAARGRPPALRAGRDASSCGPSSRTSSSSPAARRFHLRTLRAEDFPLLPEPGGDTTVVAARPRRSPRRSTACSRSASRDETRPILTGVLVSAEGTALRMVATDSYRLSVKETTLEAPLAAGFEANVPGAGAARSSAG